MGQLLVTLFCSIDLSTLKLTPGCLDYYNLKSDLQFCSLFKAVVATLGPMYVHMDFRINLPISTKKIKKLAKIFFETMLHLYVNLERTNILSFLTSKHGIVFHLYRPIISHKDVFIAFIV